MRSLRITLCFTVFLLLSGKMFGQAGATGTILGTVTDTSGAIVPNAKVTITNTSTNVDFRTNTTTSGDFNAPSLNPGPYKVTVEAAGFQKSVTTGIVLTVNQKVRADAALKPGAVSETLEVTAQAVTLDTDSAALSQLVSQQQVEELPLNGRNFMQLLLIGAGAVTVGGEQGTMRQGEGNAISVNGGRPEGNSYTLDGLVNTDPALVTPAVILSQDAIGEFKVESGNYPAEYGFSASQINIVSKGGSNRLHGAFFEDNRNDAYDALPFPTINQFVQGGQKTLNPLLRQNQFGLVMSGPVYIPKLYNGRNKTFFMANYEGWRINNGGIAVESVPNPAVLQGDFSGESYAAIAGLPGGPLPLYGTPDCSKLLDNGRNCMPVDPLTGQAFPGNVIPADRFTSRIGQVAVNHKFWADPTVPNQPEGISNFTKGYAGALTTNQQTYRGDQNLGKLGSVFGRFTYSKYVNHSLYNSGSLDYGIESYFENQKAWAVSHTINIGQKNVNNFRFGYLSANAPESSQTPPSSLASELAETGVFTHFGPLQETWPNVGLTSYSSGGGPVNSYSGSDSPAWEWADSFTTVHGRHTLGFGIDYRTYSLTRNLDDDFYGDWGFSSDTARNNSTGDCAGRLCGTGNAVADMMLGYFSSVGGFVPGPLSPTDQAGNPQTHIFHYFAPYAEDDWKVTPKLTLSMGLRWDYRSATSEKDNHFFWLDVKNSNGGLCFADPKLKTNGVAPGGDANSGPILRYCGSVPHPGSKTPFAPRLGLNYRLTDRTVLRGGYGIFYDSYEGREIDDSADIYPYSIRNSLSPGSDPTIPKLSNQMFPVYDTLGPFPASTLSFIAVIESENPLNPYVQSWTASVERELSRNTTLEVNYIGTHSVHLLNRRNIAQPFALSEADQPFCQHKDPATGDYDHLTVSPCAPHVADANGNFPRLPYRNFTSFYIDSDFHGYAHYRAMNVKFERRAGDMAITSVYTWANSKDDKSATAGVGASGTGFQGMMDNHNPDLDYGPSDFDVDQRFVSSFIYNLPIGRGKKIMSSANRATDLIVGGWELTGIATFQTGFPYSVNASDIGGVQGTVAQRASRVAGCDPTAHLTGQFQRLNLSCFTQPLPGTFGDTPRNFLRQPGINNFDIGFAKNFHFTESLNFKLTVDTFNTFNHHQYADNVGGLTVGGSGGGSTIDNSVNSSAATAGRITGASAPRIIQLGGKLTF
jgi:hypothetical protein